MHFGCDISAKPESRKVAKIYFLSGLFGWKLLSIFGSVLKLELLPECLFFQLLGYGMIENVLCKYLGQSLFVTIMIA